MADFLFVLAKDGGWWLKISTVEQLTEYHRKCSGSRYEKAIEMYKNGIRPQDMTGEEMTLEERIKLMTNKDFKLLQCAVMLAQKCDGATVLDGFRMLNMEMGMKQMRDIEQHGAVYINKAGGSTFDLEYTQFCRRKEPIFPDFKESDIRIKRFNGGQHWYAYIGDMQIRAGDNLKWNTYEAAEAAAKAVVAGA